MSQGRPMNINALVKIALGILLLLVFLPSSYIQLPQALYWILIIIAAIIGIKLIVDGVRSL